MDPSAIGKLVQAGFFSGNSQLETSVLRSRTVEQSVAHFAHKVISEIQTLSDEQKQDIEDVVQQYYQDLARIRTERDSLNQEVSQLFDKQNSSGAPFNMLQIMSTIVSFRLQCKQTSNLTNCFSTGMHQAKSHRRNDYCK